MILGLDIGGANTKAASADGSLAESTYLPLWKNAALSSLLESLSNRLRPEAVAVVMTGELADCYSSRHSGVSDIKIKAERAFHCPVYFWGVGGFSSSLSELAAANWSASAALVGMESGSCLFADMGSTTTDLIPIKEQYTAESTDFLRLAQGELIYTGMIRTNLAALMQRVTVLGRRLPLSSELFAVTGDAYLSLGQIGPQDYSGETPDGGPKTREGALRRLARTVCSDLSEIGEEGALQVAECARRRQARLIRLGIERQMRRHDLKMAVVAGAGENLLASACEAACLQYSRLSDIYGSGISQVFPAYAVARLLQDHLRSN
ncbi:MAG: Hydantoinase/oxoprolinase [Methanosaeta sp. PtaB.Bin039]|nr:MAG: Hydantoinase/oxoprolinase [Methanosaeta sp. PtaB.Bin039]OPY47789.1 MAG: Hydantoinase/oxoprolinase [Methanosaeta sp. PtaU1.Bin028]